MRRLNITWEILDKLGFSDYWDEDCDWGGRTLEFSNGTKFRIAVYEEKDDEYDGYGLLGNCEATYVAEHYDFSGFFAIPPTDAGHYDLFFLHEMYECIEKEYPDCLEEFTAKCKELNMKPYIDEYLASRNKKEI